MTLILPVFWHRLSLRLSRLGSLPKTNGQQQQPITAYNISSISPSHSRPVAFVLSVFIIISSLLGASTVFAEDMNGLSYTLNSPINGEAMLTGRTTANNSQIIDIPASVTFDDVSFSVTSIARFAFNFNQLTSVTLPSSITSIGVDALSENQLETVIIPRNVTSIGESAFFNNELISVNIPNSVTSIGASAFEENNLTSVTFLGDYSSDFSDAAFTGTLI
jgi:hypothetical protein